MRSFKDTEGRTWAVSINAWSLMEVKGLLGVDLVAMLDDGARGLGELMSDPVQSARIVYAVCKAEADRRGVGERDFLQAMCGDCINDAGEALVEELVDFFPNRRARENMRVVLKAGRDVTERLADRQRKKLAAVDMEKMTEQVVDQVERDLLRKSGASSGSVPASSEFTPDPSPSANSA